jgi:hypothetical protein
MKRREFLASVTGGAFAISSAGAAPDQGPAADSEIVIERAQAGRPHAGKVLAAIQPHADDLPLFAGGLILKLIQEGYTGYLIRTTNDDHTGPGSVGEGVLANERDNLAVAGAFGMKKVYELYYRNHMLDAVSPLELRLRLILPLPAAEGGYRGVLRPVVAVRGESGPLRHGEGGGGGVLDGRYMAKDYPEHLDAGLKPHAVMEKYYFARGPQLVNRVVDTTALMDRKIAVNLLNTAQGPTGQRGAELRRRLTERGLRLPELGDDDHTANCEYTRRFVLDRDAETGKTFGLGYAEAYHYIGPAPAKVEDCVRKNAVKL